MLVMPNPRAAVPAAMPRPSSATDSRKPIARADAARTVMLPRARVPHGVGQRFLRDADDLALDARRRSRQLVELRARWALSVVRRPCPPDARMRRR